MLTRMIKNVTRVVGKSQGYAGLPIRDVEVDCSVNGSGTPAMETAWEPIPDELALLNAGGSVVVRILGRTPPPMMLMVRSSEMPLKHCRVRHSVMLSVGDTFVSSTGRSARQPKEHTLVKILGPYESHGFPHPMLVDETGELRSFRTAEKVW